MFSLPDKHNFTSEVRDGLTVGYVQRMGLGLWIGVCPCCGCLHVLSAAIKPGDVIIPACIGNKRYTPIRARWIVQHPEASTTINIRLVCQHTEQLERAA